MTLEEDLRYCSGELRRLDHDRYLVTLLASEELRAPLSALYAFNLELARTAESVSEPMLGRIRLQWWREAIEGIYTGSPRRHAVVQPLAAAAVAFDLPRGKLDNLIDSREADLQAEPFDSRGDFLAYAAATGGALEEVAMQIVAPGDPEACAVARQVGEAWAIIGMMRAIPFTASQSRLILPRDECRLAGLTLTQLRPQSAALSRLVEEYVVKARQRLQSAREVGQRLSRPAKRQLGLARIADLHANRLERSGFDPFAALVQESPPSRAWRLFAGRLRNRF